MKIVIFDLEATCIRSRSMDPNFKNEIIEIGAVMLDDNGIVIDRFSKFAKPQKNTILSEFCTELTTIVQDDIDGAEDLKDVLIEFYEWSKNSFIISWGAYDMKQISSDTINQDLEDYIDLDDMISRHRNLKQWYQKFKGLKKQCGMSKALNIENLKIIGTHHRGIDDAINISNIFKKYQKEFTEWNLDIKN